MLKSLKTHPSDARILTRPTTSPGLGFLERALPITVEQKIQPQSLNHLLLYRGSLRSSYRDNLSQCIPVHPKLLQNHFLQVSTIEFERNCTSNNRCITRTRDSLSFYGSETIVPQPHPSFWAEGVMSHQICWQRSKYFSQTVEQFSPVTNRGKIIMNS